MNDQLRRINEFVASLQEASLNEDQQSILLNAEEVMGSGTNPSRCVNNTKDCEYSVNQGGCVNKDGQCSGTRNGGDCKNLPPQQPRPKGK